MQTKNVLINFCYPDPNPEQCLIELNVSIKDFKKLCNWHGKYNFFASKANDIKDYFFNDDELKFLPVKHILLDRTFDAVITTGLV